jgi:hypothetical protein
VPDPQDNGSGTILGVAARLGSRVIHALAPQFLALILLNIVFLGLLVWYIDARADHAAAVMKQLLDTCLQRR